MKPENFEEEVFFSTVLISKQNESDNLETIGTGFLLNAPLEGIKDKSAIYLISNKHVYGENDRKIFINLNKRNEDNHSQVELGQFFPLNIDYTRGYTEHPDSEIDLACINMSTIFNIEKSLYYKSVNHETLANFSEKDLKPGKEVWFVGYPDARFDNVHNIPILRRGYIASMPKVDFNGKKQFAIDANVYHGSSGSPVFAVLENTYKLLGVLTGTMVRNNEIQTIPIRFASWIKEVIGLGIVLKSTLLEELINISNQKIIQRLSEGEGEVVVN